MLDLGKVTWDGVLQFAGSVVGAALAVVGAFWVGKRTAADESKRALENALHTLNVERQQRAADKRKALHAELGANLRILEAAHKHGQHGRVMHDAWSEAGGLDLDTEVREALIAAYAHGGIYDRAGDIVVGMGSSRDAPQAAVDAKARSGEAYEHFERAEKLFRERELKQAPTTTP